MTRAFTPTGATLLVALLTSTAFNVELESRQSTAVVNPCDPRVIPIKGDPLAYGRRGERCEGLYVLEVAGSADLSLVAFTQSGRSQPPAADEGMHVQWPRTPGKQPMHLRAVSLRRPVYYRMDTVRPEGSERFEWPTTDVVARLNLRREELGMVGWVEQTVGERTSHVYVPLRIGNAFEPAPGHYVARVVPGVELSQLLVTIATVGSDGLDEQYVKRDQDLNLGFYPAERPISVKVSELPAAGLYRLRLAAVLRRGGSSTATFVFYHPGSTT